jgi:cytochrome c oxidase subunit 3
MTTATQHEHAAVGREAPHLEHFEDLERQAHASRLGMWIFLATEVLLFGGAFALFASYQVHFPEAFRQSVHHNAKILGTVNTGVLLISSMFVAGAVHALRGGKNKLASWLIAATMTLGLAFLCIKAVEYGRHFGEGIYPGGVGSFFHEKHARGFPEFWTLYYGMTGLHAIHVTIGIGVLAALLLGIVRGTLTSLNSHRLDIGAIYWHLVDVIWIFLWPLFYLA